MPLVLITAPETEPVSLAEARLHLRLDASGDPASHPDDDLVTALITAARQSLDGRDGWLGRALITQTWELRLDAFPAGIRLPLPPLRSVTSIKYDDADGVEQTLATDQYVVTADEPAVIVPAYGVTWPSTRAMPEAVRARFVAGYGDAAADVPAPIKAAILLHLGTLYRDRETVNIGGGINEMPAYANLLAPYRVWSF